jgi:Septum formation
MRRGWVLMVAAVAIAGLATASCDTGPRVGDGVIDLEWAKFDEPKVPTPEADVCRAGAGGARDQVDWEMPLFDAPTLQCTQQHRSETYYVGTLTAAEAAQDGPPGLGDAVYRAAYSRCATQANTFLGGDWHRARVAVVPLLPSDRQWQGKARWYRCEMVEVADAWETVVKRSSTLRDGLRGSRPAAITCANDNFNQKKSSGNNVVYVKCSVPHTVELTGLYTPKDGKYPGFEKAVDTALAKCFDVGARYLGMTPSALRNRGGISWIAWERGENHWLLGDRSTRCYMGPYPTRKISGSIKGKRPPL